MRLLKILGITLLVMFALVLAAVSVINLLPAEQYKNLMGSAVKSATGRELVIEGDLDVDLGASLRIAASDVRFSNPEWASRPAMFSGGRVEAEVVLMSLLKGELDVRLVLESPDLLLETDAEGRANWNMGGAEKAEEADEQVSPHDEGGMPLRPFLREIRLEQVRVAFKDAASGQAHSAEFATILLHSREDDVVVKINGQIDGHPLFLEGGLVNAAPQGEETSAGFNLTGNLGDIALIASGTLDALSAQADMDLRVNARVPSLAALSAFTGRELPDQGPLDATARISGRDGTYGVSDIRASLDTDLLKAVATGGVADLAGLSGIDLSVSVDTNQLAEVVALAGVEVPVEIPPALRTHAAVRGDMNALSISDFQVEAQDEDLKVTATGAVEDVIALKGVSADIAVEAGSIASFSKYAKTELPNLGPFTASATVASSGDTYSVTNINADLSAQDIQATLEGNLADAIAVKGLDAAVTVNLVSLAVLNELTGQELPDSGPLALSGSLVSEEGPDAPSKISGSLSGDGVRARVDGSIEELRTARGISVALEVEADSVTQVARLAGQDIEHDEALRLEGNVYLGAGSYRADKLNLEVGPSRITGEATFTPAVNEGGRSSLAANFHLGSIDLERYFVLVDTAVEPRLEGQDTEGKGAATNGDAASDAAESPPSADAAANTAEAPAETGGRKKLFPSDPLPFEVLRQLDVDVEITADEIATRHVMYFAVKAHVALQGGVLTVAPLDATVGQGSFRATAKLDASQSPARMAVDINMDNGTTRHFGGTFSVDADLDGTGNSIAQIMAGIDGRIIVDVRDLELKKSALTQFGRSLTDSLNPFDKEEDKSGLTCAIVRLDIDDGTANANDRIVAQMTNVTWFGGGTIDLKTEKIDIGATSKARKGLGISLGGLASLVRVSGTLANPRIQLDPKDVAVKYGEHTLSIATGGVYLVLKGLWDTREANSDVCARVLELEKDASEQPGAAGKQAVPEADGTAATGAEADSVEDAADKRDDEAEAENPAIQNLNL